MSVEHRCDDGDDADEHDDTLEGVVHGRGHVSSEDHVDAGQHGHRDDACLIGDAEGHGEQAREAVVDRGGVGDQEDEDDECGGDAQRAGPETLAEVLGHGLGIDVLGHDTGPATQDPPGGEAADEGVAETDPGGGEAELPAELSCIAHEDDRREVRGAIGEGRQPGTDVPPPEHEAIDVAGMPARVDADEDDDGEEQQDDRDFQSHVDIPLLETSLLPESS